MQRILRVGNGTDWSDVADGVGAAVNSIAVLQDDTLVVGAQGQGTGGQYGMIRTLSGSDWQTISFAYAYCFTSLPDGRIAVGGEPAASFSLFFAQNRLSIWDGTSWSSLGHGVDASVQSLATITSDEVLVGGFFSRVNSHQASGLARLNTAGLIPEFSWESR